MSEKPSVAETIKTVQENIAREKAKKTIQIHNSGLERYFRCAQSFYLGNVLKIPVPKGSSLIVGSAIDDSVTKNLRNVIDFLEMLSIKEVETIARDSVDKAFQVDVHLKEGKEQDAGRDAVRAATIDKAVRLAKLHYEEFAPKMKPIKVQWKWALKNLKGFEKYSFVGAVDVIEKHYEIPEIVDTKTAAKSPVKTIANISTQLSTYAMAYQLYEGVIPRVRLDFLIDNVKPVARPYPSTRNEEDFHIILNRFKIFIESYEKGVFPPVNADNWVCHPNYCGYFDEHCKYALRRKAVDVE